METDAYKIMLSVLQVYFAGVEKQIDENFVDGPKQMDEYFTDGAKQIDEVAVDPEDLGAAAAKPRDELTFTSIWGIDWLIWYGFLALSFIGLYMLIYPGCKSFTLKTRCFQFMLSLCVVIFRMNYVLTM